MTTETIERALGRIEQKLSDLCSRLERQSDSLYGESGLEARLRECESQGRVMKSMAAVVSVIVSLAVTIVGWFFTGHR